MDRWVIAYDIADPERLRKVFHYLRRRAVHLQYSVFLARLGADALGDLLADLRLLIAEEADDIRIYRVPSAPWWRVMGRPPLPESIALLGPLTPDEHQAPGGHDGETASD